MIKGELVVIKDSSGGNRSHLIVQCTNCDTLFPKQKRFVEKHGGIDAVHYCTPKCCKINNSRKNRFQCNCAFCGIILYRKNSKRDQIPFCSRVCKDNAQTLKSGVLKCGIGEPHYRTLAFANYEHCCSWCRDDLIEILEVHHIDHNRDNNTLFNLIILCTKCHLLETKGYIIIVDRLPIATSKCDNDRVIGYINSLNNL